MIEVIVISVALVFLVLVVSFVPFVKCKKCGSRKTYLGTKHMHDTHRRGVLHISKIRSCLKCGHEEVVSNLEIGEEKFYRDPYERI